MLTLKFYYMHDNHTFSPLTGGCLDEIIEHGNMIRAKSPWGMLCPVIIMDGDKEVRRVGVPAHCHGFDKEDSEWLQQIDIWRNSIQDDPAIRAWEYRTWVPNDIGAEVIEQTLLDKKGTVLSEVIIADLIAAMQRTQKMINEAAPRMRQNG